MSFNRKKSTRRERIVDEIQRLKERIRILESRLENEQGTDLTLEDLNVAGPITLEPVIGRVKREYQIGERIVQRRINEVLFCRCGRRLDQNHVLRCQKCSQLVCEDCAVLYHGRVYCLWCFKRIHDLTKTDYKILLCIASGITDANDIFRITGVIPETVRRKLYGFRDLYVTSKASCLRELFFRVPRLTDAGADALAAYERIYGNDYDSIFVKRLIKEYVKANEIERLRRTLIKGR